MSLTSDIETIVTTLYPDSNYILSSWFKANLASYNLDEITTTKPLIILSNELKKEKEIQPNVNILANTRVLMWFLTKATDGVYTTDTAMQSDIDKLELIADRVYSNIFQLPIIRLKDSELFRYSTTPKFKIFNAVLIGIEAEARLKDNQIIDICKT